MKNPIILLTASSIALSAILFMPTQVHAQSDREIVEQSKARAKAKKEAEELEEPIRSGGYGLPSEGKWKQQYNEKTGPNWRTYVEKNSGAIVSFDPKTQEVRRNPGTGKFEVVRKERDEEESKPIPAPEKKDVANEPSLEARAIGRWIVRGGNYDRNVFELFADGKFKQTSANGYITWGGKWMLRRDNTVYLDGGGAPGIFLDLSSLRGTGGVGKDWIWEKQ